MPYNSVEKIVQIAEYAVYMLHLHILSGVYVNYAQIR